MASFAPEVPNIPGPEAPNFTSFIWSKPSQEPMPDMSGKIAKEGLADTLESGVKALDSFVKSNIEQKIYNEVDQQRDSFTTALSSIKDELAGTNQTKVQQPGQPLNILPQSDNNVNAPDMVKSGLNDVSNLHGALTAKKISPTMYLSNLTQIAKNLRSTFPGYRDFIDQKISQITGGNPANELVRSYMSDIAQQLTSRQANHTKVLSQLYELKGAPGWAAVMHNYTNGLITDDQVNNYIGAVSSDKWKTEQMINHAKATTDTINATKAETRFQYQPAFEHHIESSINQTFQTVFTSGGIHSLNDIITAAQNQASGKVHYSADQWLSWGEQLKAAISRVKQGELDWVNSKKIQGDLTLGDMLGGSDSVNKILNDKLQKAEEVQKMIGNQDFSGAAYVAQHINAMHTDDTAKLLSDPKLGEPIRMLHILNKEVPGTVYSSLITDDFLSKPEISEAIKTFRLGIMTQPPGAKPDGTAYTFTDAIQRMKTQGVNDPKSMNYLLSTINYLTNNKMSDEAKIKIAHAAFDPANVNMLGTGNFIKDFYDPQTHKMIPGKYAAFSLFTSPAVTQEMVRLGKTDPQLLFNYRNWAEETFGAQLYSKEVNELNTLQDTSTSRYRVSWHFDPASNVGQFQVQVVDAHGRVTPLQPSVVTNSIDNLNRGLRNMANIEKATGGDVQGYLLGVLGHSGANLGTGVHPVTGLPAKMMQAILQANPSLSGREGEFQNTYNKVLQYGNTEDNSIENSEGQKAINNALSGPRIQKSAYQYLTSKGYSPVVAAGILGGLSGETVGLNSSAIHDNGQGFGIAGWNGDRLEALKAFAKARGKPISNRQVQFDFLDHELHSTEADVLERLKTARTPAEAALIYTQMFERPATATAHYDRRMAAAKRFYNNFAGGQ